MPQTPHHQEAQRLLAEWLTRIQIAARPINHDTVTADDQRIAQERLATHQQYLIDLIAAGLVSNRVVF